MTTVMRESFFLLKQLYLHRMGAQYSNKLCCEASKSSKVTPLRIGCFQWVPLPMSNWRLNVAY